jgi:ribonuclease Z
VHLGVEALAFPVEIQELRDGEVVDRKGYRVRAIGVDHRVNALAYALEEEERPGRFNVEKALALGVPPGPAFGRLQRGETLTLDGGKVVRPEEVLGTSRTGRRIVLSGDTRPSQALAVAARGADLLVHEATFGDDEQERAVDTRHSTSRAWPRRRTPSGSS